MKLLVPIVGSLVVVCAATRATAIELSEQGTTAFLSGKIDPGDDVKFQEFLAQPRAAKLRALQLNSTGGYIAAAAAIARSVRQLGLVTLVDAAKSRCNSACTLIFAGGVARHYINASAVVDGLGKGWGLGYHEGNDRNKTGQGERASPGATAAMIRNYYELGSPAAAEFAEKAPFNGMYHISGATALSRGIATSLSAP
jgi:hypothetical protein